MPVRLRPTGGSAISPSAVSSANFSARTARPNRVPGHQRLHQALICTVVEKITLHGLLSPNGSPKCVECVKQSPRACETLLFRNLQGNDQKYISAKILDDKKPMNCVTVWIAFCITNRLVLHGVNDYDITLDDFGGSVSWQYHC